MSCMPASIWQVACHNCVWCAQFVTILLQIWCQIIIHRLLMVVRPSLECNSGLEAWVMSVSVHSEHCIAVHNAIITVELSTQNPQHSLVRWNQQWECVLTELPWLYRMSVQWQGVSSGLRIFMYNFDVLILSIMILSQVNYSITQYNACTHFTTSIPSVPSSLHPYIHILTSFNGV